MDQMVYRKNYEGLVDRYTALESRLECLKKERESRENKLDIFSRFLLELIELSSLPMDLSDKLFHKLVDYATMYVYGRLVFTFCNVVEVETKI